MENYNRKKQRSIQKCKLKSLCCASRARSSPLEPQIPHPTNTNGIKYPCLSLTISFVLLGDEEAFSFRTFKDYMKWPDFFIRNLSNLSVPKGSAYLWPPTANTHSTLPL